jgi:hypothetical protein
MTDALEFCGIPNPMIKRFVLPKRLACAAEPGVDVASRDSLQWAGNFGEGHVWVEKNMDVVGHNHIGVQLVAAKLGSMHDRIFGVSGELRVGQPERTAFRRV